MRHCHALSLLPVAMICLQSCVTTSWVEYEVESIPPGARIEVNGHALGTAPCEIKLQKSGVWVGLAHGGFDYGRTGAYSVVAYPPADHSGNELYTQSKLINPAQTTGGKGRLVFDLHLRAVAPVQTIEVRK